VQSAECGLPTFALRRSTGYTLLSKQQGDQVTTRLSLPQGTLDLLILKALALEPLHGWAVSERLQQMSSDALQIGQGSLYPSLHRLERAGWVKARWQITDNNRRAKYYELTRTGRKQLESASESWRALTTVVGQVLDLG
jgi:PadR family transcriptional regulator, regulatory protein PadR